MLIKGGPGDCHSIITISQLWIMWYLSAIWQQAINWNSVAKVLLWHMLSLSNSVLMQKTKTFLTVTLHKSRWQIWGWFWNITCYFQVCGLFNQQYVYSKQFWNIFEKMFSHIVWYLSLIMKYEFDTTPPHPTPPPTPPQFQNLNFWQFF